MIPFSNLGNFKLTKDFSSGYIGAGTTLKTTTYSLEKNKNYLFLFGGASGSSFSTFSISPTPTYKGVILGGAFAIFINNQNTSIKITVKSNANGDNAKFILYSFTI